VWKQGKRIRRDLHETSVDEKVLMVGLELPKAWPVKESLAELAELIRTAGGQVVGTITQKRDIPEGATFIGQGKLSEVAELIQVSGATTVIFDDELNGIQQRNVEAFLGCKVLDRTALILDIFSQRARSYEGKIQVELAQLQYQLTRLTGRGISMSRLGGGIGTRGPGETKLEVDRRRIHKRISQLEGQVKEIQNHRQARREERSSKEIPVAALVGYTNAGKSTLLNYLTQAGVLAEDLLFATLDPTIRRLTFASGRSVLLSDTVGFINKLPHKLIHAFKATLEEVKESTILLQLIDVSDENWQRKQDAVQEVLTEMKLGDKERITLYNKIDLVEDKGELDKYLGEGNSFGISAVTGENLPFVLEYLESALFKGWQKKKYLFSYEEGEILHQLYEIGQIKEKNYLENGIEVIAEIPEQYEAKWLKWEKESI
jgi:GTP-binding protein HflX